MSNYEVPDRSKETPEECLRRLFGPPEGPKPGEPGYEAYQKMLKEW